MRKADWVAVGGIAVVAATLFGNEYHFSKSYLAKAQPFQKATYRLNGALRVKENQRHSETSIAMAEKMLRM